MTDNEVPLQVDLDLREVIEEFFEHGALVSLAKFEINPEDRAGTMRRGYQPVNERPPQRQFERDALLRHRRRPLPVTVRPHFLDERYLTTSIVFDSRRFRLSALLRWLAERRPSLRAQLFYMGDADDGALLVNDTIAFYFTRGSRRYYVKSVNSSVFFSHPDIPNGFNNAAWIGKLMSLCGDVEQLRTLAARDEQALAAVAEIEPYWHVTELEPYRW